MPKDKTNRNKDKTLVEFKLAKDTQPQKNLKHQAEIYQKASEADRAIKVIIYFSPAERSASMAFSRN